MTMKLCAWVLLASAAAAQLVFPGDTSGVSEDLENNGDKLKELLVTSNRNSLNPPPSGGDPNDCFTPTQERGICGSLRQCPSYIPLLRQIQDKDTATFLRERICRILPRSLYFCCPVATPVTTNPLETRGALPDPAKGECGLPSGERVVGGSEVAVGSWPWLTAVGQPRSNGNFISICGATLITERHALTAAHCYGQDELELTHVRLGEHHLMSNDDGVIPQDIRISSHKGNGYNPITKENDIELLILERAASINDFVKPACLPIGPILRNDPFEGKDATVVGWGRVIDADVPISNVPMQADVPIVPLQPCSEIYNTRTLGTVVDNRTLCAGQGTTDACGGDSGGPLNYWNPTNDRYYVIGVVSLGVGCGNHEFPGVYTRVGAFMDWILNNIQ